MQDPSTTGPVRQALQVLHDTGMLGVFLGILVAGWRRWWIFGWQHDAVVVQYQRELNELRQERDEWKKMVVEGYDRRRAPRAES